MRHSDSGRTGRGLGRRQFLVGAAGVAVSSGCGYYAPEQGDAFAPWNFPGDTTDPAELAVRAAILAASPHNTQPWLFTIEGDTIDVFADLERDLGAMDSLLREMYLGLGCALENIAVAAAHAGAPARIDLLPDPSDPAHVARVSLGAGEAGDPALFAAIADRHTHRGAYADVALPQATLDALAAQLAGEPDVGLVLVTDADGRARFRDGTIAATRAIVGDPEMNDAGHRWYRHTAAEIREHRDGVTLDPTGLGAMTRVFGKLGKAPTAERSGEYWLRNTERTQTHGSAFALLTTTALEDRGQQLRCGRVFQRIHLWATRSGLALQPLNQMPERRDRERTAGLAPEFADRLAAFTGEAHAQMLFRLGIAWQDTFAGPRRPFEWVVTP